MSLSGSVSHGRQSPGCSRCLRAGNVAFEDGAACIELLKDYAALGRQSPTWSRSREILQAAGITDQRRCFDVLVRLGVFDPDENMLLRRHGIPQQWPAEVTPPG